MYGSMCIAPFAQCLSPYTQENSHMTAVLFYDVQKLNVKQKLPVHTRSKLHVSHPHFSAFY